MTRHRMIRAVVAQTQAELTQTLRRGESVLVTLIIPIALLVFFASARVLPATGRTMTFLLPGTATLAVISTGLVSLGIATAYERHYGILKLLGATPFPRAGLIAAKVLTVLLLEILQLALLVAIAALFYGWRPSGSPALAVLALLLGSVCFAGLGLAMAGSLRAESTLAAANGLFLLFLLLGGLYVPIDHLPGWIVPVARVLPASVLANSVRSALAAGRTLSSDSILLVAWAIAATVMAARTFRWE